MIKPTFLRRVAIAALLSGSCFNAPPPCAARLVWCGGRCLPPGTRETGNGSVCGRHCHSGGGGYSQGGRNAVDAAVAVGYALAVTHPQAGIWAVVVYVNPLEKWQYHGHRFPRNGTRQSDHDMFLDDRATRTAKNHSLRIWLPAHRVR